VATSSEDKHGETQRPPGGWLRGVLRTAFILILFIGLADSYFSDATHSISANQLYVALILLVALFFEDAKELVIGPLLTIKRGIEEVKREQAQISQNLLATLNLQARQTLQNVIQWPPQLTEEQLKESKEASEEAERLREELSSVRKVADEHARTTAEMEKRLRQALELNDKLLDAMESWEFRYLDQILSENTKRSLNRLVAAGELHIGAFANPFRPVEDLENAIYTLSAHGLVDIKEGAIVVATDRAKRFLKSIHYEDKVSSNIVERLLRKTVGPPPTPPTQSGSQ